MLSYLTLALEKIFEYFEMAFGLGQILSPHIEPVAGQQKSVTAIG